MRKFTTWESSHMPGVVCKTRTGRLSMFFDTRGRVVIHAPDPVTIEDIHATTEVLTGLIPANARR